MSDKPIFLFNNPILTNGSMAAGLVSSPQNVSEANNLAVQATWSAGSTPVGTTTLESSLDGINFVTVTDSSLPVSGNSGSNIYNIADVGYPYVQVRYTRTSGSGILNIQISGKTQ